MCAGDTLGEVYSSLGGGPVRGGIDPVAPWQPGNSTEYCQWVRWQEADFAPQRVLFSVRSGDMSCSVVGEWELVEEMGKGRGGGAPCMGQGQGWHGKVRWGLACSVTSAVSLVLLVLLPRYHVLASARAER